MCEKFECDPQGDPNDCLGGLDYCDDRFLEDEMIDFDDEHCQVCVCVHGGEGSVCPGYSVHVCEGWRVFLC